MNSMNMYVNINKILTMAGRLLESQHYAAGHVRAVAGRLDRAWKEFAAGLDERTAVLQLSVVFHHKAEQYVDSVSGWSQACDANNLPGEIPVLESHIRQHQTLYEAMCQAYTEVRGWLCSFGRVGGWIRPELERLMIRAVVLVGGFVDFRGCVDWGSRFVWD